MPREPCPSNPYFYTWIKELRDEAKQKDNKSHHSYSRALKALTHYPLPLRCGEEAKCVQHVGDKIARLLDKKVTELYKERGYDETEISNFMLHCTLENLPTVQEQLQKRKRKNVSGPHGTGTTKRKAQGDTKSANSQGESANSQGESANSQVESAYSQGESANLQSESANSQGESAYSQGESANLQGESAASFSATAADPVLEQFNAILAQLEKDTINKAPDTLSNKVADSLSNSSQSVNISNSSHSDSVASSGKQVNKAKSGCTRLDSSNKLKSYGLSKNSIEGSELVSTVNTLPDCTNSTFNTDSTPTKCPPPCYETPQSEGSELVSTFNTDSTPTKCPPLCYEAPPSVHKAAPNTDPPLTIEISTDEEDSPTSVRSVAPSFVAIAASTSNVGTSKEGTNGGTNNMWRYCYVNNQDEETLHRGQAAFLDSADLTGLWLKAKAYQNSLKETEKLYIEGGVCEEDPRYQIIYIESSYCDLKANGLPALSPCHRAEVRTNQITGTEARTNQITGTEARTNHSRVSSKEGVNAAKQSQDGNDVKLSAARSLPDISDSEDEATQSIPTHNTVTQWDHDRLTQVIKRGLKVAKSDIGITPPKSTLLASEVSPDQRVGGPRGVGSEKVPTQLFFLTPGNFKVTLCVDNAEVNSKKQQTLLQELAKNCVRYNVRKLQIGDFLWIAHDDTGRELVCDVIIERKRMDDLAQSITGGRFAEQKLRLKQCGVKNKIYLVETKASYLSLPESSLNQAIVNTQVIDGFTIKKTADIRETAAYLTLLTNSLQYSYEGIKLVGISEASLTSSHELLSYEAFSKNSVKNRVLTVKEIFLKQLTRVPKISQDKAEAIIKVYPTPQHMIAALDARADRSGVVADNVFGAARRKIGIAASRMVAALFSPDPLF